MDMNKFIGVKVVEAEPMRAVDAEEYLGRPIDTSNAERPVCPGYLVRYPDGYESWCPKKQFEEAYRPTNAMPFGHAIEALKAGYRVARSGWNGKNMFLFYNPGSRVTVQEGRPLAAAFSVGTPIDCRPYIMMKTADVALTIVPWVASQTDILAEDWFIVE